MIVLKTNQQLHDQINKNFGHEEVHLRIRNMIQIMGSGREQR